MFKVFLTGNIVREPEEKIVNNKVVCNFTIKPTLTKGHTLIRCSLWNSNLKLNKNMCVSIIGDGYIQNNVRSKSNEKKDVLNVEVEEIEII